MNNNEEIMFIIQTCKQRDKTGVVQKLIKQITDEHQSRNENAHLAVFRDENNDLMGNYLNIMDYIAEKDLPAIIMQDDIELCDNFVERIMREIKQHPNSVISFFTTETTPKSEWRSGKLFCMAQCYYVPSALAYGIRDFYNNEYKNSEYGKKYPIQDDLMFAKWLEKLDLEYLLVIPNLVQHIGKWSAVNNKEVVERTSIRYRKEDYGENRS